jgi:hypothetical protein
VTVAELIKELQQYPPTDKVVIVGACWSGYNEPERYEICPEVWRDEKEAKVIIGE